ncbi:unnamed protein product, partial [Oikopleura dioica]
RILRPKNAPDTSNNAKNSTTARPINGKKKHPSWANDPSQLLPSYFRNLAKLDYSKYKTKRDAVFGLSKGLGSRAVKKPGKNPNKVTKCNPSFQRTDLNQTSRNEIMSTAETCLKAAKELQLSGDLEYEDFKTLKRNILSLNISTSEADLDTIKTLCAVLNELQIKTVSPGLKILSCNMGKITDSAKLRHLVSMFPDVSAFCISEVMWDREEVLRPTNWPQNYKITTHSQIGSSPLAFSMIVWSAHDIPDLTIMKSVGCFTIVKIKGPAKDNIVIVGYRFCDKSDLAKCRYKKYLNASPMIFCDWLDKLAHEYDKPCYNVYLTGDFNFEDIPRTHDPKPICERAKRTLKNFTNVIIQNTFYRPGVSPSCIDKLHCTNPANTKVKYLRLNEAPFNFDGHCGFTFSINAIPQPIPFEPFLVTKIGSRKEIFEEAMSFPSSPDHTDFSFCFSAMTKILDKCSVKSIKIKASAKRTKFNYSKRTWALINMTNDFKKAIGKQMVKTAYARKTLSILGIKIKRLKRIDEMNYRSQIKKQLGKDKNIIWELLKEVTDPPPIEKLDQPEDVLLEKVKKLQSDTVTHNVPYKGNDIPLISSEKLQKVDFNFAREVENLPSLYPEFLKLTGHTKGSSGLSKSFLDQLPAHFITEYIFKPLHMAAKNGSYPEELRTARIQCLPKGKGCIRPIAIAEPLSSILEKLLVFFLTPFIELNQLLPEVQSGFRSNLGCDTSLYQVVNVVSRAFDKGLCSILLLFDLKNAFGTTPHSSISFMAGKFAAGPFLRILNESLIRRIKVVKNGFSSETSDLLPFGIPQGGIIAPIIFSMYVSQLTDCLDSLPAGSKMALFADDQALILSARNHDELMVKAKEAIDVICKLVDELGMTLVGYKTQATIFGKPYKEVKYEDLVKVTVNNAEIEYSQTLKYLGTFISSIKGSLSFQRNTEILTGKSRGIVQRLRSLRPFVFARENAMLLRATLLGLIQHNYAILPPMTAAEQKRLQLIFHAGLKSSSASAWWFKVLTRKDSDWFLKAEHVAELLQDFGIPSLYLIKLSLFAKSISKCLILKRSNAQRNTLLAALKICSSLSHKVLFAVPDILLIKRRNQSIRKLNTLFDDNVPLIVVPKTSEFVLDIICSLLEQNVLEIRLMKHRSKKTAESKYSWPWHMQREFNEIPTYIRNQVPFNSFESALQNFLAAQHPHLFPSLPCTNCKEESFQITVAMQCDIPRLNDSVAYKQMVAFEKKEAKIDKELHNVLATIVQTYTDYSERSIALSPQMQGLVSKILGGFTCQVGTLLQELFRIADLDSYFDRTQSLFDQ